MKDKNHELMITDIREEDFRKLDLRYFTQKWVKSEEPGRGRSLQWVEKSANQELDDIIAYALVNGYENNLEDLKAPVTFAVHVENNSRPNGYYLDKFMNMYTGGTTCQVGVGIKHLYSTRDYYEDHEDYWRVRKDETRTIYRVYLSEKWLEKFVLKHKTEVIQRFSDTKWVEAGYDLEEDGTWREKYRIIVEKMPGGYVSSSPYKVDVEDVE